MAITHTEVVRNKLADQIATDIDAGAGAGQIIVMAAADATVATLTFADPAFGAATGGTITANAIIEDTAALGGEAIAFKAVDSNGLEVYRGSVTATAGGGDLELSSTTIGANDTVSISTLTYTASL